MTSELLTIAYELHMIRERLLCAERGDIDSLHDRLIELTEAVGVLVAVLNKSAIQKLQAVLQEPANG